MSDNGGGAGGTYTWSDKQITVSVNPAPEAQPEPVLDSGLITAVPANVLEQCERESWDHANRWAPGSGGCRMSFLAAVLRREAKLASKAAPSPPRPVSEEVSRDGNFPECESLALRDKPLPRPVSEEVMKWGDADDEVCPMCRRGPDAKPPSSDGGLREALEAKAAEWLEKYSVSRHYEMAMQKCAAELRDILAQHGGPADDR